MPLEGYEMGEQRAGARTACGGQDLPTSGCELALGCADSALFSLFALMGTTVVSSDGNPYLIDGWIFLGIKWLRAEAWRGPRMRGSTEDQTCLASRFGRGNDSFTIHLPSLGSLGAEGMDPTLKSI